MLHEWVRGFAMYTFNAALVDSTSLGVHFIVNFKQVTLHLKVILRIFLVGCI